eukprot:Gregarina_sp_Poly_1__1192@NODE_1291_length_4476_cov_38_535722_g872_i0_p3_GENE_NODE_1291_length_4476_cov_38_535722_g872_i0NODE_1291_length_4476_cov_38_535722_g872_i0_p3_ORF_typecomplete_len191_score19_28_NODE_1291_length_4476_cov_38_535722_g872_i038034375
MLCLFIVFIVVSAPKEIHSFEDYYQEVYEIAKNLKWIYFNSRCVAQFCSLSPSVLQSRDQWFAEGKTSSCELPPDASKFERWGGELFSWTGQHPVTLSALYSLHCNHERPARASKIKERGKLKKMIRKCVARLEVAPPRSSWNPDTNTKQWFQSALSACDAGTTKKAAYLLMEEWEEFDYAPTIHAGPHL